MIELDEDRKLAKLKSCQKQLQRNVAKKNKPKVWQEIDDLEKQERQLLCSDGQLSPQSKFKRQKKLKPDKKKMRFSQVREYQQALAKHRKQCKQFFNPFHLQTLKINKRKTLKALEQAKNEDKDIALALKLVGIKSLKTLYIGGAKKQFQIVINFLQTGVIPKWMVKEYEELLKMQKSQMKFSVKQCLKQ